ncbi:MAG: 50S ribosomal protein L23 [Candidatus Omnitrophota bacterium]
MDQVKDVYSVIKSPLITEKSTYLQSQNKYAFWVDKKSNKIQIRKAIEKIYNVKVTLINVINQKGRTKRLRMGQVGRTSSWKKAFVTLKKGNQIKIT